MGLSNRLRERREQLGLTQSEVASLLGITPGAVGNYENGVSTPKADILFKVFDALKCDANYLFQDEMKNISNSDKATPIEMETLVKKYRFISENSPKGKETVDFILNREHEVAKMLKDNNEQTSASYPPTRIINYYYRLASAGTGQILFDMPPTKRIEIPDIPEYKKADYAIGVNGDSMEPKYNDGDMLLIEMTDEIEIGEIGIFSLNGECYVKELGNQELISLNPEYKNIPLNETARCMGRVIDKL